MVVSSALKVSSQESAFHNLLLKTFGLPIMTKRLTFRLVPLMTVAIGLTVGLGLPASAQSREASPAEVASPTSLPRFTVPDAPAVVQAVPGASIRRDQAPLPLGTVYQTPIEQFEPAFSDVPTDHWAYEAVTRLFYSGIVSGYPQ